ncbi:MAG: GNAT family N-acetyltransferase, partial [Eggerthellaceae bacterium]|nr:GNAT family N-acetyltransferase [Eggerthellaceae bacterium]
KVELIILGGTWSDYPESYQIWFIHELFRALNDAGRANCWNGDDKSNGECGGCDGDKSNGDKSGAEHDGNTDPERDANDDIKSVANRDGSADPIRDGNADPNRDGNADVENGEENPVEKTMRERRSLYETWGILSERSELQSFAHSLQRRVNAGELTYNQAVAALYDNSPWRAASASQHATLAQLEEQHRINENARHRVVGLVVETRPDAVNPNALTMLRRLGCTKVQMGIQSLNPDTLQANSRGTTLASIQRAFALLRLFGFKTHAHFMVNLLGATPEKDKADYAEFVSHPAYLPDEVKLYPCVLVEGTGLCGHYADGSWQPYTEEELVDVLAADVLATPPFTRVSRMIRDISAHDIKAGNKKTNLRQMVESRIEHTEGGPSVREIRYREIGTDGADGAVEMQVLEYETTATDEFFLQWVTPENRIAGFLRLSLPHESALSQYEGIPVSPEEAMIREVHVYGKAAKLHASGDSHEGAQHLGLGKRLVEKACSIARERGFRRINVISAVGTREYYRALGFMDGSLYQSKNL